MNTGRTNCFASIPTSLRPRHTRWTVSAGHNGHALDFSLRNRILKGTCKECTDSCGVECFMPKFISPDIINHLRNEQRGCIGDEQNPNAELSWHHALAFLPRFLPFFLLDCESLVLPEALSPTSPSSICEKNHNPFQIDRYIQYGCEIASKIRILGFLQILNHLLIDTAKVCATWKLFSKSRPAHPYVMDLTCPGLPKLLQYDFRKQSKNSYCTRVRIPWRASLVYGCSMVVWQARPWGFSKPNGLTLLPEMEQCSRNRGPPEWALPVAPSIPLGLCRRRAAPREPTTIPAWMNAKVPTYVCSWE